MKHLQIHVAVADLDQSIRFYADSGIRHLGIQVEDRRELEEVYGRLQPAGRLVPEEGATTCCYAQSEKSWVADPQGIRWETFLTTGESAIYGPEPSDPEPVRAGEACCAPACCTGHD